MTLRSAGERYVNSDAYKRAHEGAGIARGHVAELKDPVEVLSEVELRRQLNLRTYADLTAFDIDGVPHVGELPAVTLVSSAVETIPTTKLQVELASEASETVKATAVNDGQPLVEAAMNFGAAPTLTKLPRFGTALPVTLGVLDEPGQVASLIDRRIELGIGLGLDADLINGNNFWAGMIASVTGANTVAKGTGYRADAICNAVGVVQAGGWVARPLQVVIHPTTRAAVFTERDSSARPIAVSEMLDDQVDAWLPSPSMPIGEAIVADLFAGVALFAKGGLEISISTDHLDFIARGMVELKLEFRAYGWVREASALSLVTGIT